MSMPKRQPVQVEVSPLTMYRFMTAASGEDEISLELQLTVDDNNAGDFILHDPSGDQILNLSLTTLSAITELFLAASNQMLTLQGFAKDVESHLEFGPAGQ